MFTVCHLLQNMLLQVPWYLHIRFMISEYDVKHIGHTQIFQITLTRCWNSCFVNTLWIITSYLGFRITPLCKVDGYLQQTISGRIQCPNYFQLSSAKKFEITLIFASFTRCICDACVRLRVYIILYFIIEFGLQAKPSNLYSYFDILAAPKGWWLSLSSEL